MFTEDKSNVLPYGDNTGDVFRLFTQSLKNIYSKNANCYQRIFTRLPVAVFIVRGAEFIIESTTISKLKTGDTSGEVTGKPLLEVMPEFRNAEYLQILNDVYETGLPFYATDLPVTLIKKGKAEKRYYNAECQPLKEADGTVAGLCIIGFDVTSHIATKQQLQKSEQEFKELISHAPVSIAIFRGRNFIIEFANDEYLKLVDRTKQELAGKPFLEVLPEFKGQGLEDLLHMILDTGQPYTAKDHSVNFTRYGKTDRYYSNFIYQPLRNASNEVDGIIAVLNDVSDIINAAKVLEASERQFSNLVMQSPVAMGILKGEDYTIDVTNKALLQLWQREEDIKGKKLLDVFPEIKDQPYAALLKRVYETGETCNQNEALIYISNTSGELIEKYVQFQYVPLLDIYKGINGIIVTANDITAQVKARKQLEENEQYFRKMADSVPAIIVFWKSDGYCMYKNRRWFEYTGAKEEEAQGFNWLNYIDINSRPEVQQTLFSAIKNQTSLKVEFQLKRHDGEYRWFEKTVTPRYNADGKTEGFIGTLTDIHERKLAEERLKDAEERLRLAVEATGLATFDMDMQSFNTICSARLFELLGLNPKESETALQRSEFFKNVYSEDIPIIENALKQAYESGYYNYEARIILPDTSIRWITTKGKVYYSTSGKPIRMIGLVEDTTRRKQLEQHKDSFINIVSHELKTPVTSLKVYNQMLQQKFEAANDTALAGMLQKMDNQINKLSILIKDLLDTARIDSGTLQIEHKLFDLNQVIDEALEDLYVNGNNHHIIKQNDASFFIKGDALRTVQVLASLLGNAIKYSPKHTNIIINTKPEDNFVLCSVQDFGMGISPANLVNVFDKYFRINNNMLGTYPGLGIGLFISSEIIRRQGGEMWADSNEGNGSTFWFKLPLAGAANAE